MSTIKGQGRQLDERFVEMQWLYKEEKNERNNTCTQRLHRVPQGSHHYPELGQSQI